MGKYLGLRGQALSIAVGVAAGLCFEIFGYDQGSMGGLLTVSSFMKQFPMTAFLTYPRDLHMAQLTGFTVASWNLGCIASAVLAIFVGDRLGRRNMIMIGLTILLIGQIIQCSAYSWGQLLAGRLIAGLGNGFNTATVPAWQAECTKAYRRGTLLMISAGACIAAGLGLSYWMTFAFAWLDPSSASWRVPIAIQIVFVLIALYLVYHLPESPRWLILRGRESAALEILAALNDKEETSFEIRQEFLQIKDAVLELSKATVSNAFKMGDYRDLHRVILAIGIGAFQQLGGINFMTQYFALMFAAQYKWPLWQARLLAACAGTEFFLASFIAVYGIDRLWGRRSLMMFGTSGMCISMIVLCIMLYVNTSASLGVGTAFIFVFCTFFAIGWQGMSWLYTVEIVPLRVRGAANAISTCSNWLANFIVVIISPVIFRNTGYRTYIVFAVTNAVILPLIYFFYPETGLRCLEEIDYIFHTANASRHPWLDVKNIAANEPLWYGREPMAEGGVGNVYDYEASEWHQRHVRFSDEVKDSEGESTTLKGVGPDAEKGDVSGGDTSDGSLWPARTGSMSSRRGEPAPSPVISRTSSRDRVRSAGRGY